MKDYPDKIYVAHKEPRENDVCYVRSDLFEELREQLAEITRIANNVLYFNDNSDYENTLYEIIEVSDVELSKKLVESNKPQEYMGGENDNE